MTPFEREYKGEKIKIIARSGTENGRAFKMGNEVFVSQETFTRLRTQSKEHMELLGTRIPITNVQDESELPEAMPEVPGWLIAVGGGAILVILILVMISSGSSGSGHAPSGPRVGSATEAYVYAVDYIKAKYPGAKNISDLSDSKLTENGGDYFVGVQVDGLNALGGPVRSVIAVQIGKDGTLKGMEARRIGSDL